MNHNEFFTALQNGRIAGCYCLEGVEEFHKEKALELLREKLLQGGYAEMNEVLLNDPDADTLIAACETLPFMAEKRLVIVRESSLLTGNKPKDFDEDRAVEQLKDYLLNLPDTVCLVFYVRGKVDGRKKFYKILQKQAKMVLFDQLSDAELTEWVKEQAKVRGKVMDDDPVQKLWFTAGRDLTLLSNELDKLRDYTGTRKKITADDIEAICTKTTEYKIFDLSKMLLSHQGRKAFDLLETMLTDGERRVNLLSMLGRQCRQLLCMYDYSDAYSASTGLGIPYGAAKELREAQKHYTKVRVESMCDECLEMEYQIKSGEMEETGALEKVMLRILALYKQ
ncbi:MAG: DNA polymerase III subunit delta [Clostridiales bacterium]|nr:DNA polymerase III subunit delta [Clostridiales bacterium]